MLIISNGIAHAIAAQRPAFPGFVGQGERRLVEIEMPAFRRQIRRLDGAAALLMDDVQRLHQLDVVAHIGGIAGPPPAIEIIGEGRPADRAEDKLVAADDDALGGIAGLDGEGGRRLGDLGLDHGGIAAHPLRRLIHLRPGSPEDLPALLMHDLDPDLGQETGRGPVDRLEMIGAAGSPRACRDCGCGRREAGAGPCVRMLRSRRRGRATTSFIAAPPALLLPRSTQLADVADGIGVDVFPELPRRAMAGIDRGIDGAGHEAIADAAAGSRPDRARRASRIAASSRASASAGSRAATTSRLSPATSRAAPS